MRITSRRRLPFTHTNSKDDTKSTSLRAAALVAVSAIALTGCVSTAAPSTDNSTAASDTILLGAVMAETGFMSPFDTPALNSLRIAIDELNGAGGIDGTPVELRVIDTGSDLEKYAPSAQTLIDAGAKAIIVTCDYDISSPAALVAEQAGVLNVSPCVGDTIYGPRGGLDIGFSLGNATPGEASVMAEFADSKSWTNAVFLTDTSLKYTQSQCAIARERFLELGGTEIAGYDYVQGENISEAVSSIAAGPAPDVIFNCGYSPGGAQVAKDLRDGGIAAPIVSGFGMDGTFWLDSIPGLTDYYVVTFASTAGDDPDPAVNDLATVYEQTYGARPTVGSFVTGPSTLDAIVTAHEVAQSWDGKALADAFLTFDGLELLAGPTTFTPELHVNVDRPQRVLVVEDGALKFVERRAPEKVILGD
ncbi:ABC transporter substrate-binding protein [Microbacterium sp. CJ77]|uniref:ABC transporter substrate-binding protein n=1 Tax=Microbacterium sp. CJ77 TaxID=2079201 RepID=UPI000CD81C9F|nr:ABC transporter substrate-binding protein [Microbacterium sp. CJ77]